jgi:26S proteasome regulatory subunit N3
MATAEKPSKAKAKAATQAKEKEAAAPETMDTQEDAPQQDERSLTLADVANNVALIVKAVATQEPRFTNRALRKLSSLRKKLTAEILATSVQRHLEDGDAKDALLGWLNATGMDSGADDEVVSAEAPSSAHPVEVELYLRLVVTAFLMDSKNLDAACASSTQLLEVFDKLKQRSAHVLGARAFFFHARIHELQGTLSSSRNMLQRALRKATIQGNELGQAIIVNALVRSLLLDRLYDQADLLVSKIKYPESTPNPEAARFQYYLGRIRAVQLDYTVAHQHLIESTRKAPAGAYGFLQHAHKLAVTVQLLMGEIPDRDLFRKPYLRAALKPYYEITCAVRRGDLVAFAKVVTANRDAFLKDNTLTLIHRLRHSVIKAGVRKLSLSYSRISLADVAEKLHLDTAEEAEYIVAKAIRDGVIDAVIDHAGGFMASREVVDVYSTGEPKEAFHQRIDFCLKIHRESVQAMRYAPNAYRKHLMNAEELEQEMEAEEALDELAEDDEI